MEIIGGNNMNNPIEIYQTKDGKTQISVQFDKEIVWLSQAQMATIFETSTDNISLHLRNILPRANLMKI